MKFKIIFTHGIVLLRSLLPIIGYVHHAPTPKPKVRGPFEIGIWPRAAGTRMYLTTFAMAEIVNRYSSWLRVEAVESAGSGKHIADLTNKPELRKSVIHNSPTLQMVVAAKGLPPLEKPYAGGRAVMVSFNAAMGWLTYDENIKTWQDFKGKRIMYLPKTTNTSVAFGQLLKDVWKIWADVTVSYGGYDSMSRSLRDGMVDVVTGSFEGNPGTRWELTPAYAQLQIEKPGFHMIGISAEDVAKLSEVSGQPFHPLTFPKGAPVGLTLTEDLPLLGNMHAYFADEAMGEDVVYEFVRQVYEHIDEINERYTGTLLTKNDLGMMDVT